MGHPQDQPWGTHGRCPPPPPSTQPTSAPQHPLPPLFPSSSQRGTQASGPCPSPTSLRCGEDPASERYPSPSPGPERTCVCVVCALCVCVLCLCRTDLKPPPNGETEAGGRGNSTRREGNPRVGYPRCHPAPPPPRGPTHHRGGSQCQFPVLPRAPQYLQRQFPVLLSSPSAPGANSQHQFLVIPGTPGPPRCSQCRFPVLSSTLSAPGTRRVPVPGATQYSQCQLPVFPGTPHPSRSPHASSSSDTLGPSGALLVAAGGGGEGPAGPGPRSRPTTPPTREATPLPSNGGGVVPTFLKGQRLRVGPTEEGRVPSTPSALPAHPRPCPPGVPPNSPVRGTGGAGRYWGGSGRVLGALGGSGESWGAPVPDASSRCRFPMPVPVPGVGSRLSGAAPPRAPPAAAPPPPPFVRRRRGPCHGAAVMRGGAGSAVTGPRATGSPMRGPLPWDRSWASPTAVRTGTGNGEGRRHREGPGMREPGWGYRR